jgi:hypothetical protein
MLYARRKRLEAQAAAEAAGQSFWTSEFDEKARMKIVHAFTFSCEGGGRWQYAKAARDLILLDEGIPYLVSGRMKEMNDLQNFILTGEDELIPSAIEAIAYVLTIPPNAVGVIDCRVDPDGFAETVNTVLREHRIAFELIDGKMVPLASQELHTEVVAPTLRLLSGRYGWDKVETAYQDALEELAEGKPADAITDAATALQEALAALGCKGNALGPLAKYARSKGLLGPQDALLTDMRAMYTKSPNPR